MHGHRILALGGGGARRGPDGSGEDSLRRRAASDHARERAAPVERVRRRGARLPAAVAWAVAVTGGVEGGGGGRGGGGRRGRRDRRGRGRSRGSDGSVRVRRRQRLSSQPIAAPPARPASRPPPSSRSALGPSSAAGRRARGGCGRLRAVLAAARSAVAAVAPAGRAGVAAVRGGARQRRQQRHRRRRVRAAGRVRPADHRAVGVRLHHREGEPLGGRHRPMPSGSRAAPVPPPGPGARSRRRSPGSARRSGCRPPACPGCGC